MRASLDHIRSFHAVATQGSLLAAARQLGLTQPTVGRHIDLLEETLGMTLFLRGRDGMRLTEKGGDLVETAATMLDAAVAFERRAAGHEDRVDGTIRISANEILGAMLLPGLIADLMADHPGIAVEIDVTNSAANLLRRDADIAIRMFRPTQNDLVARKVTDLPMGLFAHQRYLDRHPAPAAPADLKGHVLIGLDRDPGLVNAYAASGITVAPEDFLFRSDSNIAGIQAVRAGIGIGPLHVGMAANWPNLVQILPDLPIAPLPVWLACHASLRHATRVRIVLDALAERLKSPYAALP